MDELPVVDLAPFLSNNSRDTAGFALDDFNELQRQVVQQVGDACKDWGFFQIINHGLDSSLLARAAKITQRLFEAGDKLKLVSENSVNGYSDHKGREMFLISAPQNPDSRLNVCPSLRDFKPATEQLLSKLYSLANLVEALVLDSISLCKQDVYDGCGDVLVMHHYPSCEAGQEAVVSREHKDGDTLTLVAQLNEADGLEVLRSDGKWITVAPQSNAIIVNVGDVLQVWSNCRYKSVVHRVRNSAQDRYSFAYFRQAGNETRIMPLHRFTVEANEPPRYKPFILGDYSKLRGQRLGVTIAHYAIS